MFAKIAILVLLVAAGVGATFIAGGPKQIKDVSDPSVVEAADFAVTEMNKRSNSMYKLVCSEIVSGTMQVRPLALVGFLGAIMSTVRLIGRGRGEIYSAY